MDSQQSNQNWPHEFTFKIKFCAKSEESEKKRSASMRNWTRMERNSTDNLVAKRRRKRELWTNGENSNTWCLMKERSAHFALLIATSASGYRLFPNYSLFSYVSLQDWLTYEPRGMKQSILFKMSNFGLDKIFKSKAHNSENGWCLEFSLLCGRKKSLI